MRALSFSPPPLVSTPRLEQSSAKLRSAPPSLAVCFNREKRGVDSKLAVRFWPFQIFFLLLFSPFLSFFFFFFFFFFFSRDVLCVRAHIYIYIYPHTRLLAFHDMKCWVSSIAMISVSGMSDVGRALCGCGMAWDGLEKKNKTRGKAQMAMIWDGFETTANVVWG